MPLPTTDQDWPPTDPAVQEAMADWDAWYSSDPDQLVERYRLRGERGYQNRPAQLRGGVVGRFARWWWGQPTAIGEKRSKIHIPLAADIARTSSDLLFSEPPRVTAEAGGETQDRLDQLMETTLYPTLLEGGEVGAALGGTYYRVSWDTAITDRPWITTVAADGADPTFSYGRLTAVTFWRVVTREDQTLWRHLERHEKGVILHGLYKGTQYRLGKAMPLTADPATRDLQPVVNTGAPNHLTASYAPNMRPARGWRNTPAAAYLGQSDYQGIEGLFDALDETWASWMRDLRLGKGRITLPGQYLTSNGAGLGVTTDLDREVYAGLNIPPTGDGGITVSQFQIRVAEHRETAQSLLEQAVRQAGYSAASFGVVGDGTAVTATEIRARQGRSMTTRARKTLYQAMPLADILAALLAVEAGPLFNVRGLDLDPPRVEFQDSIQEDPKTAAETVSLLRQAEAASTDTLIRMLHPDWDDDRVTAETNRIAAETGRAVSDPTLVGAERPALPVEQAA
ncbi:capsid protein [Kitasatospora sp. NPDC050543]|uniref:capsid protein n=1 Tax=Kitasatospora sp. NPDC050543 TaxID=3364054 RepID=UPI00379048C0